MSQNSYKFDEKINPKRCALIIVDMQNDYAHPEGAYGKSGADLQPVHNIISNLKRLIDAAHKAGVMVVFTRNWKTPWHMSKVSTDQATKSDSSIGSNGIANTWGADWFEVKPSDQDIVINKRRYDAFIGTDLDQILRAQRVETVVIAGIQTNVCVESTARSAFMRDYYVVVLEDATATVSEAIHRASLDNLANYFGDVVAGNHVVSIWSESSS